VYIHCSYIPHHLNNISASESENFHDGWKNGLSLLLSHGMAALSKSAQVASNFDTTALYIQYIYA